MKEVRKTDGSAQLNAQSGFSFLCLLSVKKLGDRERCSPEVSTISQGGGEQPVPLRVSYTGAPGGPLAASFTGRPPLTSP